MIEIRIKPADNKAKKLIRKLEMLYETLGDLLAEEIVKKPENWPRQACRRRACTGSRGRDNAAQEYVEEAIEEVGR